MLICTWPATRSSCRNSAKNRKTCSVWVRQRGLRIGDEFHRLAAPIAFLGVANGVAYLHGMRHVSVVNARFELRQVGHKPLLSQRMEGFV